MNIRPLFTFNDALSLSFTALFVLTCGALLMRPVQKSGILKLRSAQLGHAKTSSAGAAGIHGDELIHLQIWRESTTHEHAEGLLEMTTHRKVVAMTAN